MTTGKAWIITHCQADKTWSALPQNCTGRRDFSGLYANTLQLLSACLFFMAVALTRIILIAFGDATHRGSNRLSDVKCCQTGDANGQNTNTIRAPFFLVLLLAVHAFFLVSYVAVECPPLPQVINAQVTSSDYSFKSHVNVSCQPGYKMTANKTWIVTYCQANKVWSEQPLNCTGDNGGL